MRLDSPRDEAVREVEMEVNEAQRQRIDDLLFAVT